ncbi:Rha family transcriptional regulator [Campylobacter californiensis]|uniref:Rha family transcriptional regulator n=1 Tax=Campylobacter californiensis TaxID=1032243 RepID=UPI0014763716|nr:Rha family transcriptional regulator [Campylobacter sp. RM12916]MBE3610529.1 Rha family transcriptional regulator [Campylobacter sp. RM12916]
MNDLVINHNGIPATTQSTVSELTDNNEQSVQKLIRVYKTDLEEFGALEFSNIQIQAGLGLTYKKVYCLNEQQATLLLTYMKNTPKVREAKKILVKAFYEMKQELQALKFQHYVDKISALETGSRLESKHHQNQINGYLGKLAVVNKANEALKAELVVAKNELVKFQKQDETNPRPQTLRALLDHARKERDFFRQKSTRIEKEKADKEKTTFRALQQIKGQMEHIFTAIGAVEAYVINDDRYFMENNEILKG